MTKVAVDSIQLLSNLEKILDSNPQIDEIGFIHPTQFPTFDTEFCSSPSSSAGDEFQKFDEIGEPRPVQAGSYDISFWHREHKLGISTNVLFFLYNAAKDAFLNAYERYKIWSDTTVEKVGTLDEGSSTESEVMKHSRALLLLSCDFGSAWNSRKLILSKKQLYPMFMEEELRLSALVLSYSPKSDGAWSHRRWVIKMIADKCENLQEIVDKESELVKTIADKFKMNYRAWNHRCWLVSYMSDSQVRRELQTSRDWAGLHVADNSCFHYRSCLLLKMVENVLCKSVSDSFSCAEFHQLWKLELEWLTVLIKRYVGRESLWLHRRFLSQIWGKHLASTNYQSASFHACCRSSEKCESISTFVKDELKLFYSCSVILEKDFDDYQAQTAFSTAYIAWLAKQMPESFFLELRKSSHYETLRLLLNDIGKRHLWDSLIASCESKSYSSLDCRQIAGSGSS